MKNKRIILISILLLFSLPSFAQIKIVANECSENAIVKPWQKGIKDRVEISNIVEEFDNDHKELVRFLDELQIMDSERLLLSGIDQEPVSIVKTIKYAPHYQWSIPGKEFDLGVIVDFYKGCISKIMLINVEKDMVYSRRTKLQTKP